MFKALLAYKTVHQEFVKFSVVKSSVLMCFAYNIFWQKMIFFGYSSFENVENDFVNIGSFEQLGPELLQLNNEQTSCPLVLYFRLCVENCR